jgi:tRNA threonylcarbamoyl adenosine modification protein YeaZ
LLLAIDTSAGTSAAIFQNECLASISFEDQFGHAENIGEAINRSLLEASVTPKELTAVAVGRGPAPYTGLRVGMAAATALSKTLAIPLFGVITLDAIAHGSSAKRLLVITDAKRRELFGATYLSGRRHSGPTLLTEVDLDSYQDYEILRGVCDATTVGGFAISNLSKPELISDITPLYLRSPDVTPGPGKRVSG